MGSHWVAGVFSCSWILLILVPLCSAEATVASVNVHAARELMCNSGHRYLDVRTIEEFNQGHPEGAINVPYMFFNSQGRIKNKDFLEEVLKLLGKDDFIVVGCASGARSLKATTELVNAGFKHTKNMEGGYAAWVENGFAIRKPQSLM